MKKQDFKRLFYRVFPILLFREEILITVDDVEDNRYCRKCNAKQSMVDNHWVGHVYTDCICNDFVIYNK
jgi:hypothetical protein